MNRVPPTISPDQLTDRELTTAVFQGYQSPDSDLLKDFEQQQTNQKQDLEKKAYNDTLFTIAQQAEARHVVDQLNLMIQRWQEQQSEEITKDQERHAEPNKEAEKASEMTSRQLHHIQSEAQRDLEAKVQKYEALAANYQTLSQQFTTELRQAHTELAHWKKAVWKPAMETAKKEIFSGALKQPKADQLTTSKLNDAAQTKLKHLPKDIDNLKEKIKTKQAIFKSQKEHLTHLTDELEGTPELMGLKERKAAGESGLDFKIELLEKNRELSQGKYLINQLKLKNELEEMEKELNNLVSQNETLKHFVDPEKQETIVNQLNSSQSLKDKFAALQSTLMQEVHQSANETMLQNHPNSSDKALQDCYESKRNEGASSTQAYEAANKISSISGGIGDSLLVATCMKEYFIELNLEMLQRTGVDLKQALGSGPIQLAADYANNKDVQRAIIDYHERLNAAQSTHSELTARTEQVSELRLKQKQSLDSLLGQMQEIIRTPKETIAKNLTTELAAPELEQSHTHKQQL